MTRLIALLFLLLPAAAMANDWDMLKAPGTFAMMRHALAPGIGDPADFRLEACSTQRNLDETGRAQARRTGAEMRARGILFDQVLTSQWCRTRETATLLDVGPVTDAPSLNSFFGNRSTRDAQTAETLTLLRQSTGKLLLVTHQVNISAIAGRGTASGEVLVMRLVEGSPQVVGSILLAP